MASLIDLHTDLLTVALVGNPNVGKTTLFNRLTRSVGHVGNWAGKTTSIYQCITSFKNKSIAFFDLPGTYSLNGFTDEEKDVEEFLLSNKPQISLVVVGGDNLPRSMFLLIQMLELTSKIVVAVNKVDLLRRSGQILHLGLLSEKLGVPIVAVNSLTGEGINSLMETIIRVNENPPTNQVISGGFGCELEESISCLAENVSAQSADEYPSSRWMAIKILERDELIRKRLLDTNPKLLQASEHSHAAIHSTLGKDPPLAIIESRYAFVDEILKSSLSRAGLRADISERIDEVLLHPLAQGMLTVLILVSTLWITFAIGAVFQDIISRISEIVSIIAFQTLDSLGVPFIVVSFIASGTGVIGALSTVLKFVPVIFLYFFVLAFLENTGVFSRIVFSLDRMLSRVGLEGRIFFPLSMSLGCNIMGIANSRIIEDTRLRKIIIGLNAFVPCSARIAVIMLLLTVLFENSLLSSILLLFLIIFGYLLVIFEGVLLSRYFNISTQGMVIEFPTYSIPRLKDLTRIARRQTSDFLRRAGKIMFLGILSIWFLTQIPPNVPLGESLLGILGSAIKPLFIPIGLDWQATVALLYGFVAKENALGALITLFGGLDQIPATMSLPTSIAFLVFYTYYIPCLATVAAMRKELGTWKTTVLSVMANLCTAYVLSLIAFWIISVLISIS